MSLLLDTHAFLWFAADDRRLSRRAREAIVDPEREVWVSLATAWEIAIKRKLGKLEFPLPLEETFSLACESSGLDVLDIRLAHVSRTTDLSLHHRDPFDRLLVAQCLVEGMALATRDASLTEYGIDRVW